MSRQLILSITILLLFCKQFSLAATIKDSPATPEVQTIQASILMNEISYKNSSADFINFKVKSDLPEVNLKGLSFYNDKIFKTIEANFVVKNNDSVTLFFNSDQEDSEVEHKLYTTNSGLTSTTEQIAILEGPHYFDFFCWYQDPVSKSEQSEFPDIATKANWPGTEITSCFPSKLLKKEQSLIRVKTGTNLEAWQVAINNEEVESEEEITESSESPYAEITAPNFTDQDFTNNQQKPNSKETAEKSVPESTNTPVIITEIYPVPDKEEFEWVELFNQSEKTVDLAKWQIDDADGGSKPKLLDALKLSPGTYTVINLKTLKINLNNSSDSVRLFTPSKELADQVNYDEATKKSSYQLQEIDGESQWRWNSVPSPGKANPILTTITGQITTSAKFDKIYHFDLSENPGEQSKILVVFDENLIKGPQAEKTFLPGRTGKFLGELIENSDQKNYSQVLKLYQFELDETTQNTENNSYLWGLTGILGGTGSYFAYRKKSWIISLLGKF